MQAKQFSVRVGCRILCTAALALAGWGTAAADDWPTKPISIIVGYPAGGTNDLAARVMATGLAQRLGVSVVVDNRTGAAGSIAAQYVARAKPDGYTLYMISSAQTLAPSLRKDLGYDPVKSFDPIALAVSTPYALLVNPQVKARSVAELIALAKAEPGKLKYGSSGVGGGPHLAGERFKNLAGVDIQHIPYRGDTQTLTDLTGGQISMAFISVPTAKPLVDSGQLRALAVTSDKPVAALKNVPTIEQGGGPKGFTSSAWWGLVAPAGTPKPILAKLEAAATATLTSPQVRKQFGDLAFDIGSLTGESYRQYIASQTKEFADVVQAAHITVE